MTDRPLGTPHPEPVDDPTRDIRLPPLAGQPAGHVPAQWSGMGTREPAPVREHEPPLQEQPVQELPAQAPPIEQRPAAEPSADGPPVVQMPAVGSSERSPDPAPTVVVPPVGQSPDSTMVLGNRTDEKAPAPPRERTRPFTPAVPPPAEHDLRELRPAAPAPPKRDGDRRWPWVLLVLLPILVIAGTGFLLFFLLGGG